MRGLRSVGLVLAMVLAACSGDSVTAPPPPDGPVSLAIVSGQNQTVTAGRDSLIKPVMVAVMRGINGRLVMRVVGTGADAQTIVNGSPVPGAVICAHPDSLRPLTPWVQCTNTDSTGHAPMWFNPGTRAGHPSAQIRGTLNGEPAVFDTVTATVVAGPATTMTLATHQVVLFAGQSYNWRALVTGAADHYGNAAATSGTVITGDTAIASEATGTVHVALDSTAQDVAVTALDNLDSLRWTITTRCAGGGVDSSHTVVASDLATYSAAAPRADSAYLTIPIVPVIYDTTWTGGVASVQHFSGSCFRAIRQFADSVQYWYGATCGIAAPSRAGSAVRSDTASVRTYIGGSRCLEGTPMEPAKVTATT